MEKQLTDKSLVHRHTDKQRNLIINRCSTDLEKIINGHNPETGNLNNDVWDRLDKMALEIEAHLASREAQQAATPTAQEAVPVAWRSVERKFYRSEWPLAKVLEARNGGLVTDEGEAWSYRYTHKDGVGGEYDMLTRREPVAHPPQPSEAVVEAAQALGSMPEGYCFCSTDRIGDDSKAHEPECADLRAALAAMEANDDRA